MRSVVAPGKSDGDGPTRMRHRPVPERRFGDGLIVARPVDGGPVVLAATAAYVWRELDEWVSAEDLDRRVAVAFPDVTVQRRRAACAEILEKLGADDLVERG